MAKKIKTNEEFRHWVKVQLAIKDMKQKDVAESLNLPESRISEVLCGKNKNAKIIFSIVTVLGGETENFEKLIS